MPVVTAPPERETPISVSGGRVSIGMVGASGRAVNAE
jgi:hypothetical protein